MKRREFLRTAGIVAAGAALAACGSEPTEQVELAEAPPAPECGTITVWVSNPVHLKYFDPGLERFLSENPDFGCEVETMHVSGGIYEKFMAALLAGKGAPDTVNVASNWMAALFKGGVVKDTLHNVVPYLLEDYPNYNTEFLKWSPYTDLDGAIYGVELGLCPTVYYYRKDLYDQAGVDPTAYVTYDDFVVSGQAFNEALPGQFSMVADTGSLDTFGILMMQNGGGYFDKDGNVIVDCAENVEALQLTYDMALVDKMAWPCPSVWGPGMWAALEDGTAAGNIGADWYGSAVLQSHVPDQAGKWAITAQPTFRPDGAVSMQHGGGCYCITQQSEAPDEVWELLDAVLMSAEGQISKYESAQFFPNRLDVMNDPRIVDGENEFLGGQKAGAVFAEVGPLTVSAIANPFLPETFDWGMSTSSMPWVWNSRTAPR